MHVSANSVFFSSDYKSDLAVSLKAHKTVDNMATSFLKHLCPFGLRRLALTFIGAIVTSVSLEQNVFDFLFYFRVFLPVIRFFELVGLLTIETFNVDTCCG